MQREEFKAGALISALGLKDQTSAAMDGMTKLLNHSPNLHTWRALVNDIRSQTNSNKGLLRMTIPVKAQADAARQDFREGVPGELAAQFFRKLDREEWGALYTGMARADLLSIGREDAEALMRNTESQRSQKAELAMN